MASSNNDESFVWLLFVGLLIWVAYDKWWKVDEVPDRTVSDLKFQVEQLSTRLDRADQAIQDNSLDETAELSPDEKGFDHMTDGALSLTASLDGVTQRGSAADATLQIGNLTNATLKGCEALVSIRYTKDGAFNPIGFKKIEGDLEPGKWNRVTLALADTKADSVSALRIRVPTCRTISLINP